MDGGFAPVHFAHLAESFAGSLRLGARPPIDNGTHLSRVGVDQMSRNGGQQIRCRSCHDCEVTTLREMMHAGQAAARVFVAWTLLCVGGDSAEVVLTVDAGQPAHRISSRLVGIFLEDINFGADGGLNAELVKNGSFEFPNGLMGWSQSPRDAVAGSLEVRDEAPAYDASPHFLRIRSMNGDGEFGVANGGFRGMGVRAGEQYHFSVTARAVDAEHASLKVRLVATRGKTLAVAEVPEVGSQWSRYAAVLVPSETALQARLLVTLATPGAVDLDMVSLYPAKTWKNRPHGLRADLVQMLADLKPAFFRFPGGCIVEGSRLADRYRWKHTIGELPDRKLNFNRWNTVFRHRLAPDYFQSYGVGFFEYFQMAEEIGAEPLPILNCGMACQFQSGELVPLDELQPFIQDMLDLVEFANGPSTSEWGAKRAALGHPEPFGMKLLGVGNEQWGPEYFQRYEIFVKALKEKHPEIELVSGSGPFPSDRHYQYAWRRLRELGAEIVDEHCYAMPDWFLRAATRYDRYDRSGPKVFMGEYAAQSVDITSPDNRNNLRCALAEAAFLTGIERNSDVVVMSAYAPLLAHLDAWQWRPNLIWFDNLTAYGTPNYYVQQLFSLHRGDVVLPVELSDSRIRQPPSGRIGVGTFQSSAEFKDIRVRRDEVVVFSHDSIPDPAEMTTFRGRWQLEDGVLRQSDAGAVARAHFGDDSWTNYTLSLKARKLAGREGFLIIFRNSSGGSFLQWNLGGWGNRQHGIQANLASHSEDVNIVDQVPGSIDPDRWYDIKVELAGARVRCYLDGELVHDVEIPGPDLPRLFATASRDDESGQIILKVVNPTDERTDVDLRMEGVAALASQAQAIVLHGDPENENSLVQPTKVAPITETFEVPSEDFTYTFRPHSITVLRMSAE
jgi:alpha-L-arabinofuranosidase